MGSGAPFVPDPLIRHVRSSITVNGTSLASNWCKAVVSGGKSVTVICMVCSGPEELVAVHVVIDPFVVTACSVSPSHQGFLSIVGSGDK